jgi:nicotinamidase/pyrazinamidase
VQPTIDRDRSVLLIVDVQPDFLPGGALPVPDGDAILEAVNRLLARDPFGLYVATQDWHPESHVSFASNHEGKRSRDVIELHGHPQVLWPDHCVQGTPGAELDDRLSWEKVSAVIRKGTDPAIDSYSGFRNNWDARGRRPPTGLAGYLEERRVRDVWVCGLARDYCVKWSAEDAVDAGFRTTVLWDLTRPVDPASDATTRTDLEARGIGIVESSTIIP